jgi:hypothetical protein
LNDDDDVGRSPSCAKMSRFILVEGHGSACLPADLLYKTLEVWHDEQTLVFLKAPQLQDGKKGGGDWQELG